MLVIHRARTRADLGPGLSYTPAAALLWTPASPETYDLLILQHGSATARIARWLADTLADSLLRAGAR